MSDDNRAGLVSSSKGAVNKNLFDDDKKAKVILTIQENKDLWGKMLKFLEIDIKDIKEYLTSKGIIVETNNLKDFLSQKGIHFK
jgi:hypothetical protein